MAVVIIPAYRPDYELGNIAQTMYELGAKIIVVDDGSGNEFVDRFEDIEDICTVLRHDENMGKGAAIKTALYIAVLILGLTRSVGHRRRKQELRTGR